MRCDTRERTCRIHLLRSQEVVRSPRDETWEGGREGGEKNTGVTCFLSCCFFQKELKAPGDKRMATRRSAMDQIIKYWFRSVTAKGLRPERVRGWGADLPQLR